MAVLSLTGLNAMKLRQYFYHWFAILIVSMVVFRVQAATVVYQDFDFVSDETIFSTPFDVTVPGTYKAELVDFEYPVPFDILALGITQDGTPLGIGFGTGSFTFHVSTPGTLFAHLAAVPETGGQGLYGLEILSVPVPAAIWLFLSGVVGIVTIARRGRSLTMADSGLSPPPAAASIRRPVGLA